MDSPQSFGRWLRSRRRELDLTQSELAGRVGCAPVTIKKIEADALRPSRQMAEILVRQVGVAAEDQESWIRFARGGPEPTTTTGHIPANNLPIELSSFIGRERDLRELKGLVLASRLVTLTGVGGVGKTRLAAQAGVELLDQFSHGVWFVELAPLADPALLPDTLLAIFKINVQEKTSALETLQNYLQGRRVLLILDNCEHLIDAAAHFALALLKNSSGTRILATSREAMNVAGEKVYPVPPLALPDLKQPVAGLAQLTEYDAVRLFVERASHTSAAFEVRNANALTLAQICCRLDGLPLAIELAAARIRVMSLEQINAHLDDRFRLLTSGSRTALPRQKTLRALIDWSYELLSAPERLMLQRVSVFVNGWTLEAAEQVCVDESMQTGAALDLLSNLIDKSLIAQDEHSDGVRYRILETIRQYGYERLLESGEHELVRTRHLRYFTAFAEQAGQKLKTRAQRAAVPLLQADLDNMRAALSWAFSEAQQPGEGLRLACALQKFTEWDALLLREQLEWYQRGLSLLVEADKATTLIRAKALCLAGGLISHFGNYLAGQTSLEAGVAIYRNESRTDKAELSFALNMLALVYYMDDASRARALGEESVQMSRALGERGIWYLAESLRMNGWVAYWQNDFALARTRAEEGERYFRALGDEFSVSDTLYLLGQVAHLNGDYAAARPHYGECLRLNRNNGLREYEILAVLSLADLDHLTGDFRAARAGCETALEFYRAHNDIFAEGKTLTNLARISISEGNLDEAIGYLCRGLALFSQMYRYVEMGLGLHAFADALFAKGHFEQAAVFLAAIHNASSHFKPIHRTAYLQSVESIKHALGPVAFRSAWDEGSALALDAAVTIALRAQLS